MGWYGQECKYSHEYSSCSSIFCPLSSCTLPVDQLLVSLNLTGPVKPVVALRAQKLSLVLELGYEIGLNWF